MFNHGEFKGELNFISISDVFQILGGNRATGVLQLKSRYAPSRGRIYFVNGNPVNASYGTRKGLDALYPIFGWTEGKFEFDNKPVQVDRVINRNRMQIVLDALRKLDDGDIEKIGPHSENGESPGTCEDDTQGQKSKPPVIKGPLIDYLHIIDEQHFFDGQRIVTEGGHGSWIWIVLEGRVTITRETNKGPVQIAVLAEGSFIGTFTSLLFSEFQRTATATAAGNVHLGMLDIQRLSGEYSSLSLDFRRLLLSMAHRLKKISDKAIIFPKEEWQSEALLKDKKLIMEKDLSEQSAFTIRGGEAVVMGRHERGYFPLLTLEREDVFGYIPFIDLGQEPDHAAVFASEDVEVKEINTEKILIEYERQSNTFKHLIENVSSCISMTTRLTRH
ncbi:DUF4388 domain-containing protein [Thermodesulfobacteriota bacterium]